MDASHPWLLPHLSNIKLKLKTFYCYQTLLSIYLCIWVSISWLSFTQKAFSLSSFFYTHWNNRNINCRLLKTSLVEVKTYTWIWSIWIIYYFIYHLQTFYKTFIWKKNNHVMYVCSLILTLFPLRSYSLILQFSLLLSLKRNQRQV